MKIVFKFTQLTVYILKLKRLMFAFYILQHST